MSSRLYSLDSRPGPLALSSRDGQTPAGRRAYASGWLILTLLTVIFAGWLAYRWIVQPSWPAALPSLLAELLGLAQLAAAVTIAILWAGLLWRRARSAPDSDLVLSLEEMYALSPKAFEHYVANLFRRKGYRVAVRGRSGDHGVDLELSSATGRRAIVQCKRYRDTVGEEVVRGLFGTVLHETAHHAFLVTTADISDAARQWAAGKPITLIDGPTLFDIARSIDDPRTT